MAVLKIVTTFKKWRNIIHTRKQQIAHDDKTYSTTRESITTSTSNFPTTEHYASASYTSSITSGYQLILTQFWGLDPSKSHLVSKTNPAFHPGVSLTGIPGSGFTSHLAARWVISAGYLPVITTGGCTGCVDAVWIVAFKLLCSSTSFCLHGSRAGPRAVFVALSPVQCMEVLCGAAIVWQVDS